MNETKKRNIVIGSLCGVLLLMVVGYAAFSTLLNIEGTTSISSNWDIKITGITSKDIVGSASDAESQVADDLSATFKANLVSPGDSISYDITIENNGNLNAQLDSINMSENTNESILIETSGIQEGDKLNAGSNATLTVKVTYNPEVTSQPENLEAEVTITLDYVQEGMRTSLPETIDFETASTTNSITVTVPKINGATYEFKKDTDEYISNGNNNIYTFNQINHNTSHNIQVKVTRSGKTVESETKQARTNTLPTPSVSVNNNNYTASMTFPAECNGTYTCSYTLSGARTGTTTVTSTSASVTNSSTSSTLTVVAKVNDGYNTTSSSGTIKAQPNSCFVAGTKVWTEKGLINIEDLKIGDKVYSYNEKTKQTELKEITNFYVRHKVGIATIKYEEINKIKTINNKSNANTHFNSKDLINDNEISSTLDHPYYVKGKGWTRADEIVVGDKVLSINNSEILITNIQKNITDLTTVYNIAVENNHNYYVGNNGLLVHNDEMGNLPFKSLGQVPVDCTVY